MKKDEFYKGYRIGRLRGSGYACSIVFEKAPDNKGRIILIDGYNEKIKEFPVEDMDHFLKWIQEVV